MSEVPNGLYYTKEHEWLKVEGDEVTIGITDHAQNALTDIVYIELPESWNGSRGHGRICCCRVSKICFTNFCSGNLALAGEITAVNEELEDTPELMNTSPYGDGWIIKMRINNPESVSDLMSLRNINLRLASRTFCQNLTKLVFMLTVLV